MSAPADAGCSGWAAVSTVGTVVGDEGTPAPTVVPDPDGVATDVVAPVGAVVGGWAPSRVRIPGATS